MDSDNSDDCKQVKFSPEVQVRVFNDRPIALNSKKVKGPKVAAVKSRLGKNGITSPTMQSLHSIKKKIIMKPMKTSPSMASRMKSDLVMSESGSIHSRLDIKRSRGIVVPRNTSKSVFNRLGLNK